jgi:uncharacterized protein YdeI (YjbR/CyaY-like superfamily)
MKFNSIILHIILIENNENWKKSSKTNHVQKVVLYLSWFEIIIITFAIQKECHVVYTNPNRKIRPPLYHL